MLTSYSIQIGNATNERVNMSDVGVMMAEIIRITMTECLRKRLMNPADNMPSLPSSQHYTGSSNTMPIRIHIIINVPI